MKLWVKPIPRRLRFHDTRHSTAAILLRSKVPLAVVQKVLRHSDSAITVNVYGNLGLNDLRDAVNVPGERGPPSSPARGRIRVADRPSEPRRAVVNCYLAANGR